jgi:hypothetical protein
MLTRSKAAGQAVSQDNSAPADQLSDIPMDRAVVWTYDVCKAKKSGTRMGGYRKSRSFDEGLRNGMFRADFLHDVQRGMCTIEGFQLSFEDTIGSAGECTTCFRPYKLMKRGRVFTCGHQVCFVCEQAPSVLRLRCRCGQPYVRIP